MNPVLIRVALADDHPVTLFGAEHELADHPSISIDGLARNSTELIALLDRTCIDVLVCDYAMPGGFYGDGLALLSLIRQRYPHVRIVVMTMLENPAMVQTLMKEVRCIVSKSDMTHHLLLAVQVAFANGRYASPTMEKILRMVSPRHRHAGGHTQLTSRELEVIRMFVSGLTVNDIATRLHRSKKTISTQKNAAMRKLNIEREVDLVHYAIDTGLVSSGSRPGELPPHETSPTAESPIPLIVREPHYETHQARERPADLD